MSIRDWARAGGLRGALSGVMAAAVRALWLFVLPLLLAANAFKYLVPRGGFGWQGVVARTGHQYPVALFGALFLLLVFVAHHWRSSLPGGAFGDAATRPEPKSALRQAAGTVGALALALGAALGMRAYLGKPYEVLNGSMLPTLEQGDRIATDRLSYALRKDHLPARGDVVVFPSAAVPLGAGQWPEDLVKRVVGLPGDTIEMHGSNPVINGWPVPTCPAGRYLYVLPTGDALQGHLYVEFLGERAYLTVHAAGTPEMKQPYVVRPGEVFVVGDNRANSFDSRSWNEGRSAGVPVRRIDGWARWFLVGTHRSGDADFGRLFRALDAPQSQIRQEGVDVAELESGVAKCLRDRPKETNPPPPSPLQSVASVSAR